MKRVAFKIKCVTGLVEHARCLRGHTKIESKSLLPSATLVAERLCFHRCVSVHGRGGGGVHPMSRHPPGKAPSRQTAPAGKHQTPPPADGYCSGRYASHWNAFLFKNWFAKLKVKETSHGYIFLYLLLHKYLPKSVQ